MKTAVKIIPEMLAVEALELSVFTYPVQENRT
jgi:hypothetical protein